MPNKDFNDSFDTLFGKVGDKQKPLNIPVLTPARCPGCDEADFNYRQEDRKHLCAWCGYDHDKGEHTGLQSA